MGGAEAARRRDRPLVPARGRPRAADLAVRPRRSADAGPPRHRASPTWRPGWPGRRRSARASRRTSRRTTSACCSIPPVTRSACSHRALSEGVGHDRLGDLYREHVSAVSALAADLSDEQLSTFVRRFPGVDRARRARPPRRRLLADAVTGRMDGAPGPEWTARHVSERAELPVADLVAELRTHQDAIAAVDGRQPATGDSSGTSRCTTPTCTRRSACGELPEPMWRPVLDDGRADAVRRHRVAIRRGRTPTSCSAPSSPAAPAPRCAPGVCPSTEQLDELCIFGPREDDQPVP